MSSSFNKKGSSVIDIIFVMVFLVVIGLIFFFVNYSFSEVKDDIIAGGDLGATESANLESYYQGFSSWNDYAVGFIFFGLIIGILVTAYFVDAHPVFFVISLILFIFVIFVGVFVSNAFQEVINETDLAVTKTHFPITIFIINNLIMLLIATFVMMSIILYGKSGNSQGGGF